jgi:PAS domain S-box-containing protein
MRIKDCAFKRVLGTSADPSMSAGLLEQPEDEYRLHYVVDGAGFIRLNGEKHFLRNDFIFITYPKDNCSIAPVGAEVPYTSYMLSFATEKGDEELVELLHGTGISRRILSHGRNLRFLFDEILANFSEARENSLAVCGHYILALLLSLSGPREEEPARASSISYVDKAIELLRAKVREQTTLTEICEELHITEPHFIRIFKSHMGVPPMKYLMRLRMEEAAYLLGESNLPIYQVAETLSFSSEAHFSRTFKQHQGMTPMNYRTSQLHNLKARRDRSEKDLEIANSMIQTIIDASPDLIFYKNLESITMWCNDAYAQFVGLPKERILGRSDFEIHPRQLAEFFLEKDRLIFKNNKAIKNEEWLVYPNGERRKFEVYKAPLRGPDGATLGLLGISRDISDREEATRRLTEAMAEEENANRQKRDFLLTMSEEIVAAIAGVREALAPAGDSREPAADGAAFECDYLTVLAEETIAFTRFESGEDKPKVASFRLGELCARLRKSIYNKYSRFNVELRLKLDDSIPNRVFGDELRLYHLLIHLITTSIKYSQQGLIEIECGYSRPEASIKIRISQAHFSRERIESFSQMPEIVEGEHSFFLKSTDLSLAIAGKLLKMMNGRLTFKRIRMDQVEFEVEIALPDAVDGLGRIYSETAGN